MRTCFTCARRGEKDCTLTGLDHEVCKSSESRPFWKAKSEPPCDLCVHHEGMDAGQCVHCDGNNSRFQVVDSQQEQLKAFLDQQKDTVKYDPKSRYYDHGGIEVLDIIKAKLTPEQYQGFCLGNAIKYTCRANHKGDYNRDLEKAEFYAREAR